jgi:beta-glucosidase
VRSGAAPSCPGNDGTLPLAPTPGRALLTVPFAPEGEALLGTWTQDGRGDDVISPARAIQSWLAGEAIIDDGRFGDRTMHPVRQADITVAWSANTRRCLRPGVPQRDSLSER